MAIKMRVSKDADAVCVSCGATIDQSVDIFDIKIGSEIVTLCDDCMNVLMTKALNATCYTNGRVKQPSEIKKINDRSRRKRQPRG